MSPAQGGLGLHLPIVQAAAIWEHTVDSRLGRNRQTAKDVCDLMFNQCKPREAIQEYAGATYMRHNPHVADGKEAFIA